ncbi:hypothetical protein ACUL41_03660 [Virgibacillus natechei]
MRKQNRQQENAAGYIQEQKTQIDDRNYYWNGAFSYPMMKVAESERALYDAEFWQDVRADLSENQWKWVTYFVIEGMPVKEIAGRWVFLLRR